MRRLELTPVRERMRKEKSRPEKLIELESVVPGSCIEHYTCKYKENVFVFYLYQPL